MKVSIIIPCYNDSTFLENVCISCLEQTYQDIEIVFVNDGSTDDSLKKMEQLSYENQGKIKIFSSENQGLSKARENGLKISTGDFIFFLDTDDTIENCAIEKLVEKQKIENSDIVIGQYYLNYEGIKEPAKLYNKNTKNKVEAIKKFLTSEMPFFAWGKLFRKSLLDKVVFYPYLVAEDLIMTSQILLKADVISCIEESIYNYTIRKNSHSKSIEPIKTEHGNLAFLKSIDIIKSQINEDLIKEELCVSHLNHLYALIILDYTKSLEFAKKIKNEFSDVLGICLQQFESKKRLLLISFFRYPNFTQKILVKTARKFM